MRTIWHFAIEFVDDPKQKKIYFEISMPQRAAILYLRDTCGSPKFWAMVNTEEPKEYRKFCVYQTGENIEYPARLYIGTFLKYGKIWHLFEVEQ